MALQSLSRAAKSSSSRLYKMNLGLQRIINFDTPKYLGSIPLIGYPFSSNFSSSATSCNDPKEDEFAKRDAAMVTTNCNVHFTRARAPYPWNNDPSSKDYQWGPLASAFSPYDSEEEDEYDNKDATCVHHWHAWRFEKVFGFLLDLLDNPGDLKKIYKDRRYQRVEFIGRKGPDGFRTIPKGLEDHANKLIHYVVNMKNLYELELVRVLEVRYDKHGAHRFKFIIEVLQAGKLKIITARVGQYPWIDDDVHVSVWRPHAKPPHKSSNQGGVERLM